MSSNTSTIPLEGESIKAWVERTRDLIREECYSRGSHTNADFITTIGRHLEQWPNVPLLWSESDAVLAWLGEHVKNVDYLMFNDNIYFTKPDMAVLFRLSHAK